MSKSKNWISFLTAVMLILSMLTMMSFPVSAGGVDTDALDPVTVATEADTATDPRKDYKIETLSDLIYAAANPTYFGKGDVIYLTADLDISQYQGDFATDFLNFDPAGDLKSDFDADLNGLGHTISNYTESIAFLNGRVNGVIRDLIFDQATVTAASTQSSIIMRTTEDGAVLDNVHITNSTLTTANQTYTGAMVSFVQNGNKALTIRNCSIVNTHVSSTYSGAAYATGIFMGRYRTGNTLIMENCVAVNSSLSGTTATSNGSGLVVGDVSYKANKEIGTSAVFDNIGVFNCEYKNYGADSTAYAIVTAAHSTATVTASNIYALGNRRSSTAGSTTADIALENLFYNISGGTVTVSGYKANVGVDYVIVDRADTTLSVATSAEYLSQDYTVSAAVTDLNGAVNEDYLDWTVDEAGIPVTVYNAEEWTFTAGDVNQDGAINVLDALITLRILGGFTYNGALEEKAMFLDGDGIITMADVVCLMRKAAKWEVDLTAAPADATVAQHADTDIIYLEEYKIKAISQNIRHSNDAAPNTRAERIARFKEVIPSYDPDVVAVQEYRNSAWFKAWQNEILAGYNYYVATRADTTRDGLTPETAIQPDERMAIFWKADKFRLMDSGMFWLSETPDVNSPTFNVSDAYIEYDEEAGLYYDNRNRICVWVKLQDIATGMEFFYFDCHFHTVDISMPPSAQLIVERAQTIAGDLPVIACGDFNLYSREPAYPVLTSYFEDVAVTMGDLSGTMHGYKENIVPERIDYFFTHGDTVDSVKYKVIDDRGSDGGFCSDHYGLYSEFVIT